MIGDFEIYIQEWSDKPPTLEIDFDGEHERSNASLKIDQLESFLSELKQSTK